MGFALFVAAFVGLFSAWRCNAVIKKTGDEIPFRPVLLTAVGLAGFICSTTMIFLLFLIGALFKVIFS